MVDQLLNKNTQDNNNQLMLVMLDMFLQLKTLVIIEMKMNIIIMDKKMLMNLKLLKQFLLINKVN